MVTLIDMKKFYIIKYYINNDVSYLTLTSEGVPEINLSYFSCTIDWTYPLKPETIAYTFRDCIQDAEYFSDKERCKEIIKSIKHKGLFEIKKVYLNSYKPK